jgi:hypothetical protein
MPKTHPGFCIAAASKLSCCLKSEKTEQNTVNFFKMKSLKILIPNPSFTYFHSDSSEQKIKYYLPQISSQSFTYLYSVSSVFR